MRELAFIRVLGNSLVKLGWHYVGSADNGVYEKNGFYLYLHYVTDFSKKLTFSYDESVDLTLCNDNTIIPLKLPVYMPPRCSWHIEKNGWLIDKGMISKSYIDYYESKIAEGISAEEADTIVIEELISSLEEITTLSDFALKSKKQREFRIKDSKTSYKVVPVEKKYAPNVLFKPLDPRLGSVFNLDLIYKIKEVNPTENKIVIKALMPDSVKESRAKAIELQIEIFFNLASNGFITPVELESSIEEIDTVAFSTLGFNETTGSDLPEDLQKFVSNQSQKFYLTKAYNQNLNYTALLVGGLDEKAYKAIYDCLVKKYDLTELINLRAKDSEFVVALVNLVQEGYSLGSLLDSADSTDELNLMFLEFNDEFMGYAAERLSEFSVDQQKVLKVIFFDQPNIEHLLNVEYQPAYIQFLSNSKWIPNPLHDALARNCMVSTNYVYSPWYSLTEQDRSSIMEFMQSLGDEVLVDFLNSFSSSMVAFYPLQGYAVMSSDSAVWFDTNSVYVTKGSEVVYRRMLINNEVYCHGSL